MNLSLTHFKAAIPALEGLDADFHNRLHAQCLTLAIGTATLAAIIGMELQAIKETQRRTWRAWIKVNCRFSYRTADRYIEAAELVWSKCASRVTFPKHQPSKLAERELTTLHQSIAESIGGINLTQLLHASDDPQNQAEVTLCEGIGASLSAAKEAAKTAPKAPAKIGSISDFRRAWEAAPLATRTKVLAVIDDVPLACELRNRNYLVTKVEPKPTKAK